MVYLLDNFETGTFGQELVKILLCFFKLGASNHDLFVYIEMFYVSKRKHVRSGMLSPVDFEPRQKMSTERV